MKCSNFHALIEVWIVSEYSLRYGMVVVLYNQCLKLLPGVMVFSIFPHNVVGCVFIQSFCCDSMVARKCIIIVARNTHYELLTYANKAAVSNGLFSCI